MWNVVVENLICCVGVFINLYLERYVLDVVQIKWYQVMFDEIVNVKCNYWVLVSSLLREGLDCRINWWLNEGQYNVSKDGSQVRNDWYKVFIGKEVKIFRQFNMVEMVKYVCCDCIGDNFFEYVSICQVFRGDFFSR